MMVNVKWGWVDNYGRVNRYNNKYFDTMGEATTWVAEKKVKYGGYLDVKKIYEVKGTKADLEKIKELRKQIAELKALFE